MDLNKNTSKRFNLLTNNHIPWSDTLKDNDYCHKIHSLIEETNVLDKFNNSSKDEIEEFLKNFKYLKKNFKTIVFIAGEKCFPMMLRQAKLMRNNGYKTFLINMGALNENDLNNLTKCFDYALQNCLFFPVLKKILKEINPDYFHVQCWMLSYHLGRFIIENKKNAKVICDFYDVTGMYSEEKFLKIIYDDFNVDQDLENEKFIFENADGIIHRYKQEIFLDYSKKYKRKKNILEFQQYPIEVVKLNKKNKTNKYQFVFCGTLIPPNDINHPKELFNASGLNEAFISILKNNHELNIYLPINGNSVFNKWIFDLKECSYPETLKIHNSLPLESLITEISKYDFGINIQEIDMKKTKISHFSYKGAMGTKNYTYLEAGLPILVNDEYSYCKELVEKNSIGIAVKSKDLINIDRILKNVDIYNLKKNVKKFNVKNNLFEKYNELSSFYESL